MLPAKANALLDTINDRSKESLFPVVICPDGRRYVCRAIMSSTHVSGDEEWTWLVFGVVDEIQGVYYGYVTGSRHSLTTFDVKQLLELDMLIAHTPELIRGMTLPSGWVFADK